MTLTLDLGSATTRIIRLDESCDQTYILIKNEKK